MVSKHICWRGFKRMCDRCSRSLFHAPHLNNSPIPAPRATCVERWSWKRPSVHLSASAPSRRPTHRRPANAALLSRRAIASFVAFPRFKATREASAPLSFWLSDVVRRRSAAVSRPTGDSTSSLDVQEWRRPRRVARRRHLCRQLRHQA